MTDQLSVLTRRRLLEFAAGGYLGLNLGGLWRAHAAAKLAAAPRPIRACILVFYYGGPSHIDTYDLKPDAPAEVRGEFKPISTTVPGVRVCEHLPRTARHAHRRERLLVVLQRRHPEQLVEPVRERQEREAQERRHHRTDG